MATEEVMFDYFNGVSFGVTLNQLLFDDKGSITDFEIIRSNNTFQDITKEIEVDTPRAKDIFDRELFDKIFKLIDNSNGYIDWYQSNRWYRLTQSPICENMFLLFFNEVTDLYQFKDDRFHKIVSSSSDAIQVLNSSGVTIYGSDQFFSILGYKTEERLGKNNFDKIHPEDRERVQTIFKEVLSLPEGESRYVEYRYLHKCGEWVYLSAVARNYLDDPIIAGVLVGVKDVSAQKKAESLLRESEEKYRLLVEKSNEAIIIAQDGRFCFVNSKMGELLGVSSQELLGNEFISYVWPDDRPLVIENHKKRADGEDVQERYNFRIIGVSGEPLWVRLSAVRIPWRGREAVLTLLSDINELVRVEDELSHREETLRQITDNIVDLVWTCDMEMNLTYVSPSVESITGFTREEYLSRTLHDKHPPKYVKMMTDLFIAELNGEISGALERGRTVAVEVEEYRKDGTLICDSINCRFIFNRDGEPIGLVGVTRDLSKHRKIEETLRKAMSFARDANRAKSEFLANMSHEIRTPMNGVIGLTGLLIETELSPLQRSYTDLIRSSAQSLLMIINDILDFSKIEAGKLELEYLPFDLLELCDECLETLVYSAEEKHLFLACEIDPDLPRAFMGDAGRVRQVLLNLLGNAIKFTGSGSVILHINSLDAGAVGSDEIIVNFKVVDTGIGIPNEKKKRLFSKFSQIDASTTREFGGTGLGLAISRQLVNLFGGEIGISDNPEGGSVFWFNLPLKGVNSTKTASMEVEAIGSKRVLLDIQDRYYRKFVQKQLISAGAEVEAIGESTPFHALKDASTTPFDYYICSSPLQARVLDEMLAEFSLPRKFMKILLLPFSKRIEGEEFVERSDWHLSSAPLRNYSFLKTLLPKGYSSVEDKKILNVASDDAMLSGKALLAEDNSTNQIVARGLLQKIGLEVDVASNGEDVLRYLKEGRVYDLILMDIQMPYLDGFETTKHIRRGDISSDIPIIAMTANALDSDRDECLVAGMDGYVSKPISVESLKKEISRCLGKTHSIPAYINKARSLPWSSSTLVEDMMGDRALAEEVVSIYLEASKEVLLNIDRASENEDWDQLILYLPAFIRLSSNSSVERLVTMGEDLLNSIESGDVHIAPQFRRFRETCTRVLRAMNSFLDGAPLE